MQYYAADNYPNPKMGTIPLVERISQFSGCS